MENFNNMRKSRCKLCDGFGVVTILKNNEEFAKSCNCIAGKDEKNKNLLPYKPFIDLLLFPIDFKLTEKEQEIYNKLKKGKEVVNLACPF